MGHRLIVRAGREDDVGALIRFNLAMAEETEGRILDPDGVSSGVREVVNDTARGFYVVAEKEGRVVGSLMVTTEWSDWRNGFYWWIQSVYVRPEFRRLGIYRRLYAFVKSKAVSEGNVCGFRLYVEGSNTKAQDAYRASGMTETSYRIFEEMLSTNQG